MVECNVSFPIEAHTSIIVSSGGEELSLPYDNRNMEFLNPWRACARGLQ